MPSTAFLQLTELIQQARTARSQGSGGREGLAAQRRAEVERRAMFQPPKGVRSEPADGLADGSFVVTPDGARDDVMILYIHGGGFRTGTAGTCRMLAAHLALGTGARVVLSNYRLAPEHPFPAGLDDCEAAFAYADQFASRVVVGGGSAGANLALGVLLRRVAAGDPRPLAGVLYSGIFDLRPERYSRGSWVERAVTDVVLAGDEDATGRDYLAGHRADDPLVSPMVAELSGLPPLFLQASSAERLLDDTLELAARAARAGVHVETEIWPHMSHTWQIAPGRVPESTEAVARTAAFINRVAQGRIVDGTALQGDLPASSECREEQGAL